MNNPVMREAFTMAMKEKMQREIRKNHDVFSISELKEFCSGNGIEVIGDRRFKKSFVDAIKRFFSEKHTEKKTEVKVNTSSADILHLHKKQKPKKEEKNNEKINSPANLVNAGEPGKYRLYINADSEIQAEVVEVEGGKKRVYILHATGEFAHLVEGGVHREWFIPYVAIEHKYFIAPCWMKEGQKRWIIRAMRSLLRLHRIFEARVSRKDRKDYASKPRQYGGRRRG